MSCLTLTRRDFVKGMLVCAGAACCTLSLQSCDRLFPPDADSRASRARVWAWLRMRETGGDFGVPTSRIAYLANLDNIDVAMPLNGGKLQADGSWLQEELKVESTWAQTLPKVARHAGQLYMPAVGNNSAGTLTVLNDTDLQSRAAENLVTLALSGRYDSPWDGVYLELEGIPAAYGRQLGSFLHTLSDKIKQAGLLIGISVGAVTHEDTVRTYDLPLVGDVADYVNIQCYNYWQPPPASIAPYWWIRDSIEYALDTGIEHSKLIIGLSNYSKYWPNTSGRGIELTHDRAMKLVDETGSTLRWIEDDEKGPVREWFAKIGTGHVWIHDGLTHGWGLQLLDQYQLLGSAIFALGMGDDQHWHMIEAWRTGRLQVGEEG